MTLLGPFVESIFPFLQTIDYLIKDFAGLQFSFKENIMIGYFLLGLIERKSVDE